ncbi:hypothetical protein ACMFMF_000518 [Clarireedia jacksonii]
MASADINGSIYKTLSLEFIELGVHTGGENYEVSPLLYYLVPSSTFGEGWISSSSLLCSHRYNHHRSLSRTGLRILTKSSDPTYSYQVERPCLLSED